jgi:hypothetical protein
MGFTLKQKSDIPGEAGDAGKVADVSTAHAAVIDGDAAETCVWSSMSCTL